MDPDCRQDDAAEPAKFQDALPSEPIPDPHPDIIEPLVAVRIVSVEKLPVRQVLVKRLRAPAVRQLGADARRDPEQIPRACVSRMCDRFGV